MSRYLMNISPLAAAPGNKINNMNTHKPQLPSVWIFNGINSRFPSGVFDNLEKAETWIAQNKLTGVLTNYPLNKSIYDWAVENTHFSPKNEEQKTPEFIGKFSSASQEHLHYENGKIA